MRISRRENISHPTLFVIAILAKRNAKKIMILLAKGLNQRTIATKLDRNASIISGEYRSTLAERKSSNR